MAASAPAVWPPLRLRGARGPGGQGARGPEGLEGPRGRWPKGADGVRPGRPRTASRAPDAPGRRRPGSAAGPGHRPVGTEPIRPRCCCAACRPRGPGPDGRSDASRPRNQPRQGAGGLAEGDPDGVAAVHEAGAAGRDLVVVDRRDVEREPGQFGCAGDDIAACHFDDVAGREIAVARPESLAGEAVQAPAVQQRGRGKAGLAAAPTASRSSAWPVSPAPSRSGSIAHRQKSSTGRSSWSTVVMRSAASPVAARPGRGRFCRRRVHPRRGPQRVADDGQAAEPQAAVEQVRGDVLGRMSGLADGHVPDQRRVRRAPAGSPLSTSPARAASRLSASRSPTMAWCAAARPSVSVTPGIAGQRLPGGQLVEVRALRPHRPAAGMPQPPPVTPSPFTPLRTRPPPPGRRRRTSSPGRTGRRGASVRAAAWPGSARRSPRSGGRARCRSRSRSAGRPAHPAYAPALQHRQHLHRERLVQLDQVHVVEAEADAPEQLGAPPAPGRCPCAAGSQPAAAQPTSYAIGSRPSSPSLSSATTRQAAAASFCWPELPAVTVPSFMIGRSLPRPPGSSRRGPPRRGRRSPGRRAAAAPRPAPPRRRTCRPPRPPRRPLVAARRVLVGGLAADLELAGQVLGGLDHPADRRRTAIPAGSARGPASSRSYSVTVPARLPQRMSVV